MSDRGGLGTVQRLASGRWRARLPPRLRKVTVGTYDTEEEALQAGVAKIPLGRMADPEEIASTVLFLASDRASYVTGVNISMDGVAVPTVANHR